MLKGGVRKNSSYTNKLTFTSSATPSIPGTALGNKKNNNATTAATIATTAATTAAKALTTATKAATKAATAAQCERALENIEKYFTLNPVPKIISTINADNGAYKTYIPNNQPFAQGHFNQVAVFKEDNNENKIVKFLFEQPAPLTMFISKINEKLKKKDNLNDNFLKRCKSFQGKHNLSGDEIDTIARAYLSSLVANDVFKNTNSKETIDIINAMIESNEKYIITIINGMVSFNDIKIDQGQFGDNVTSVKMEAGPGGTRRNKRRKLNKRRKTKRRKSNKSRRRR